jgi:hypothetical protein
MVTSLSLATISSKKTTSSIVTEAGPQSEAPGTGENSPTEHEETPVEAR